MSDRKHKNGGTRFTRVPPFLCLCLCLRDSRFGFRFAQEFGYRGTAGELRVDVRVTVRARMMAEFDIPVDESEEGMIAANANIVAGLDFGAALAHNDAACRYQLPVEAFHAEHFGLAVASIARAAYTFFMCHVLLLSFGFSILVGLPDAAAASGLLLFLRLGFFRGYCFRRLSFAHGNGSLDGWFSFRGLFFFVLAERGSLACHQALASRDDVVDSEDGEFLAMTPAMPVAFLRFVLEDNQFLAARVFDGCCQHHRIRHHRRANHRVASVRDKQHFVKLYLLPHFDGQPVDFQLLAHGHLVLSSTAFNDCKHVFVVPFSISAWSLRIRGRRGWMAFSTVPIVSIQTG